MFLLENIIKEEKMYEIILPKSTQKEFDRLSNINYSRIADKLFEMENNPRPIGCIKLSDSNDTESESALTGYYMKLTIRKRLLLYIKLNKEKMFIKESKFDCVEMQRSIRQSIIQEAGNDFDKLAAYIKKKAGESSIHQRLLELKGMKPAKD